MSTISKKLCFAFILFLLALAAVINVEEAKAGAINGGQSEATFSASDSPFPGPALLSHFGAEGSLLKVSGHGHKSDRYDDRREDRRYPRCKSIRNHDSRRYKQCVFKHYVRHKKDRDSWERDRRDWR
jgi:hypothetical protein